MNRSTNLPEIARFGTFELNVQTGELVSIGGTAVEAAAAKVLLREQPFQILRILVERQRNIVTRQEIRQILWPDDTVVEFDRSINVAMAILRKALSDDAEHPKYIETLARRGYRLIVPVEWQSSAPTLDVLEAQADTPILNEGQENLGEGMASKHWRKVVLLGACAAILVVAGYMSWRRFRDVASPGPKKVMLAVMPFANLTGDANKEYVADGLTEEMISQLGRLNPDQLGVIARTSVMGYKQKDVRLDQIGRDLSVQYVLENSLRESGDHLRLTAQLIQVKDQTHLWSQDYDYAAKDFLNVEDEVAKSVAREIRARLTPQKQEDLARSRPVNPEAFDAFLQGYHYFQGNTDRDADMAAEHFERATQIDPSYALAWAWLSRARNWQANEGLVPMEEGRRLSRAAIERALALNPDLPEAHAQMGRIKLQVDYDWAGANSSFQRAVALEPASPEFLRLGATMAECFGRFDEALRLDRRAIELDPLNAGSWERLAETELYMGQLDRSAADYKKALELDPDHWISLINLSRIHLLQGRPQDALPEIEHIDNAASRTLLYALTYYALGRRKEADAALSESIAKYRASDAFEIAMIYAFRNQTDEAFKWLDRAYAQRDPGLMATKVEPLLKSLHNNPRFAAFLKKLNLPN